MPIRDMTSRISPGMRVVRTQTVPQSEIQRGQQTAAENIEAQEQYSAYEERARAAEDVINEYNDEAEELQRLADEYESETDSARRQVLSEEIRDRIRSVNSTGERLNEEIDRYNSAYDTALAAGVITGGGKYSSGVERVSDPFVMSDGGVLVEVGGAGPEVAYLTPTGDADAARKRAETILNTPLPPLATPVERIDSAIRSVLPTIEQSEIESRFNVIEGVDSNPLRRAYNEFRESPTEYAATTVISAATGGALGAGMRVLPKVASKIPGVERLGVLARPVADKQIQRVETAVAARVSPAAGETVGNVARSLTTPAMLPLNVAGGAYALDVGQRVTAPTPEGKSPTTGEMGSRLGEILVTEIIPGAAGAAVGSRLADRFLDWQVSRKYTRIPRNQDNGYPTDMGDNPFSAESLSRLRNINGEMVFIPAGKPQYRSKWEPKEIDGEIISVPILRTSGTHGNNPFSAESLSRLRNINGEMVFIPAGRQTVRRNYSTDMGDNPFSAESLSRLRNVNGEMVFIPAGRQTVGIPREINWDGIPLREEPQNRGINGGIMDAQDGGNILIMRPQETILQMQPKEELTAFIVPSINTQASNSVAIRQRSGDLDALLTESPITTRMQSGGRRVIYFPATNQDEQTEQTTPILYNAISFLLQQQQKPTTLTRQSRAAQAEIVSTTPILATSPVLELRSRRASILDEPLLQSRKNKSVPPFPDIDPIIPDSPFGKRKSSKSRFTERFRLW